MIESRALRIGLGTVQFGAHYGISNSTGKTASEEVSAILEFAANLTIQIIDTASGYGDAEKVLGKNDIKNFRVVSKFLPPSQKGTIQNQFSSSLQDLGVASLYGYMAHRPLDVLNDPAQWLELLRLKEKGLIAKIGFSLNAPSELDGLLAHEMRPDIVQVPFNYFDNRFYNHFARLKEIGCEIHTRSTFLQGLFFVSPENLHEFFKPVKPVIKDLQKKYGDLLPLYLLKYVHDQPLVDCVIVGTETVEQLRSNLKFLNLSTALPEFKISVPDEILMPMYWPKTN
jgi:aryl-alcohol dehydrogenase-like predicted oxidoreductase